MLNQRKIYSVTLILMGLFLLLAGSKVDSRKNNPSASPQVPQPGPNESDVQFWNELALETMEGENLPDALMAHTLTLMHMSIDNYLTISDVVGNEPRTNSFEENCRQSYIKSIVATVARYVLVFMDGDRSENMDRIALASIRISFNTIKALESKSSFCNSSQVLNISILSERYTRKFISVFNQKIFNYDTYVRNLGREPSIAPDSPHVFSPKKARIPPFSKFEMYGNQNRVSTFIPISPIHNGDDVCTVKDIDCATYGFNSNTEARVNKYLDIANFWGGVQSNVAAWNRICSQLVFERIPHSLNPNINYVYEALNQAMSAASFVSIATKYKYDYIPSFSNFLSVLTSANNTDPTLQPKLITASYPEYISVTTAVSSGAASILMRAFSEQSIFFQISSSTETRKFTSFSSTSREQGLSRAFANQRVLLSNMESFLKAQDLGVLFGQQIFDFFQSTNRISVGQWANTSSSA
jgi:hypothetical protein